MTQPLCTAVQCAHVYMSSRNQLYRGLHSGRKRSDCVTHHVCRSRAACRCCAGHGGGDDVRALPSASALFGKGRGCARRATTGGGTGALIRRLPALWHSRRGGLACHRRRRPRLCRAAGQRQPPADAPPAVVGNAAAVWPAQCAAGHRQSYGRPARAGRQFAPPRSVLTRDF